MPLLCRGVTIVRLFRGCRPTSMAICRGADNRGGLSKSPCPQGAWWLPAFPWGTSMVKRRYWRPYAEWPTSKSATGVLQILTEWWLPPTPIRNTTQPSLSLQLSLGIPCRVGPLDAPRPWLSGPKTDPLVPERISAPNVFVSAEGTWRRALLVRLAATCLLQAESMRCRGILAAISVRRKLSCA